MNKKNIVSVIVCLAIAGVSFWGGMQYSSSKKVQNRLPVEFNKDGFGQNMGSRTGQGMRTGQNGGGFTSGEVLSIDATSMTVKLRDGGSKIVLLSPSSKIEKTVDGSISDVIVGKSVMITGVTNPDGSVSATSIQMRPILAIPAPAKIN